VDHALDAQEVLLALELVGADLVDFSLSSLRTRPSYRRRISSCSRYGAGELACLARELARR
jgi:hypothetical protein